MEAPSSSGSGGGGYSGSTCHRACILIGLMAVLAEPRQSRRQDGLRRSGGAGGGVDGPDASPCSEEHLSPESPSFPYLLLATGRRARHRSLDRRRERRAVQPSPGFVPLHVSGVHLRKHRPIPGGDRIDHVASVCVPLMSNTVMENETWESALHLVRLNGCHSGWSCGWRLTFFAG